jgi:lysophospholipase
MDVRTFDRRAHPEGASFSIWEAPDGWPLRIVEWPQPSGAQVRGSLLFLGGRSDFIEKYLEAMAHWYAQGWNVTSFDWRGQGDSRGEKGWACESFDPMVSDLTAFLAEWGVRSSGPRVAIAHSMGGHLSLRSVAARDPALSALVLVAPMIAINTAPIPTRIGNLLSRALCTIGWTNIPVAGRFRALEGGTARQRRLTASAERYQDELWWHREQPGFDTGVPTWGWVAAAYRSMAALRPELLKQIDMPVLLLGAEKDRLVQARAIRRAASLLPGAELMMFPDAGHEILREEDGVRLAALARIDAFLDEHASR